MIFLLFFVSICLLALAVYCQLRMFRLRKKSEKILASLVLGAANIIFSTYVLSELRWINSYGYLAVQAVIAVATLLVFFMFRQKVSPSRHTAHFDGAPISQDVFLKKVLLVLLGAISLAALVNLFLAIYVPPNNYDSMTYHLSRVGYWLQHMTLRHYYTQDARQTFSPPDAEILILWVVAFLKSDLLANCFQWLAYCGTGVAVYCTGRVLGFSRRGSLFSALTYLSLPMVVLQSSSTQNDLVVTFFAITFFYFFHSGLKEKNSRNLLLSGIACGLAVGTKGTIFYMAPAIAIVSLIFAVRFKIQPRLYFKWVAFCLCGVILFGAYNYVLNYKDFGNPFAPEEFIHRVEGKETLGKTVGNIVRYGYDAVDFRGLPEILVNPLNHLKQTVGERLLSTPFITKENTLNGFSFHPPRAYEEDVGWFGFLGFFFILPIFLWFFFRVIMTKTLDEKWAYAFIGLFFFVFFCFSQAYTPYKGRYFVLTFAFEAPLVAAIAGGKMTRAKKTLIVLVSLVATYACLEATLVNSKKLVIPLRGHPSVFHADFYQKRYVFGGAPQLESFARFIDGVAVGGSRLGHVVGENTWDYTFFGRRFSRTVIPIKPGEFMEHQEFDPWHVFVKGGENDVIRKHDLDFLIVSVGESRAEHSFDPVFLNNYPSYIKSYKYFRVMPGQGGWNEVVGNYLAHSADIALDYERLLNLFSLSANLSIPQRILLDYASQNDIKRVSFVRGVNMPPGKGLLLRGSDDEKTWSVLVRADKPEDDIDLQGKVEGNARFLNLVDEKGKTFAVIPVGVNGSFSYKVSLKKMPHIGTHWRLFQLRVPEIEESSIPVVRVDYSRLRQRFRINLLADGNSDGISSKGLYGLEGRGANQWRWTDGKASVKFFLLQRELPLMLKLTCYRPADPGNLRINFSGHRIVLPHFAHEGLNTFYLRIDPNWLESDGVQSVTVENTPFVPDADGKSTDTRRLGLRIEEMSIYYGAGLSSHISGNR
jgi:4-amino-4-deoxy-L-arabinose transferase-like glycosyltransferase